MFCSLSAGFRLARLCLGKQLDCLSGLSVGLVCPSYKADLSVRVVCKVCLSLLCLKGVYVGLHFSNCVIFICLVCQVDVSVKFAGNGLSFQSPHYGHN